MADSKLTVNVSDGRKIKNPTRYGVGLGRGVYFFALTPDAILSHHHRRATPCQRACVRTALEAEGIIVRLEEKFMTLGKPAGSPKQGKPKV